MLAFQQRSSVSPNTRKLNTCQDAGDSMKNRAVVISLGNLYMKDDGIGIRVAKALKEKPPHEDFSVHEHPEMDLTMIEKLQGASKVIIVDSVRGGKEPGTVSKYTLTRRKGEGAELPSLHSLKLHDILDLAMATGILTCPVVIIGVEPKDDSLGEGLSPEVELAIPKVIEAVIAEL
jgi:hydrogenase maturation protease